MSEPVYGPSPIAACLKEFALMQVLNDHAEGYFYSLFSREDFLMSKFETGEPMRYGVPTKQFVAGADIEAGQAVSIDESGKAVPTGFDTRHCWAVFGAKPER